jgi:hypothetical protein
VEYVPAPHCKHAEAPAGVSFQIIVVQNQESLRGLQLTSRTEVCTSQTIPAGIVASST